MSHGIQPNEKLNAREVYGDIIDIEHWEPSRKHPRMSLHDRAAQFAPFAALVGYDEMVDEEARLTDRQIEPGEEQLNELNRKLNRINELISGGTRPEVTITYFVPDEHKVGGRYDTVTARVKRIDITAQKLILLFPGEPGPTETLSFDRILDIQGKQIGEADSY